jgi:uncharacterized protein YbjT (DUF2867 family)
MNRILIIGATGRTGRQVVAQLPRQDVRIRAMVRNPETAGLPADVEVIRGDLTAPETVEPALEGIDTVFLVWTASGATVGPVLERIARRARRIVFLSAPLKTPHPLFQQPNPGRTIGEAIERAIEGSGLEYTFLRPGMFSANALLWWAPQIRAGDLVRWPHLGVPTAPIDERDIAAVGVRALCEDGHAGAEYVLTGPESLSQGEQIATIGAAIGRTLRGEEMSTEEAGRELAAIFPPVAVKMLMDAWGAAAGRAAHVTSTVAEVTGVGARTLGEWARDNAAAFRR